MAVKDGRRPPRSGLSLTVASTTAPSTHTDVTVAAQSLVSQTNVAVYARILAAANTHHLRELKALVDIEKEAWARKMQTLLRRACHATDLARERGIGLTPSLIGRLRRRFEAILAEGLAFHEAQPAPGKDNARRCGRKARRTGHNLLLRLEQRKEDVLRFLYDPRVPFTDNQAERDVRMMKLRQKISGGFRSSAGAAEFADLRSVISTAQKQGWDILPLLMHGPTQLLRTA